MNIQNKKLKIFQSVILVIALIVQVLMPFMQIQSRASSSTEYSGVLEDLQKDENFDASDYPSDPEDYSLKVIQIAEGTNGELFVYVYQPSALTKFLLAKSIVISSEEDVNQKKYQEYSLSLMSMSGVLSKYLVEGFSVKNTSVRYYSISEIFRDFNSDIDTAPDDDNTINQKAFAVGMLWTVTEQEDSVSYQAEYEDVIDVLDKHVGYIEYDGGTFWFDEDVQSHYVAFSTDHNIDKILEVDISFVYKTVWDYGWNREEKGPHKVFDTLYSTEILEINTSKWFSETYKYNRIQSINDFLTNEGTSDMKDALSDMEWVLRFFETETEWGLTMSGDSFNYIGHNKWSEVTEVALFRIMYEYEDQVYNLGVVDDKQSGDLFADGTVDPEVEDWFDNILQLLLLVVGISLLTLISPVANFLGFVIKGIYTIIKIIFKFITFPFRLFLKQKK